MSHQLITKLANVVSSLEQQARTVDQANKNNKAFLYRRNKNLFSETLFRCQSEYLLPYVSETKSLVTELESLFVHKKSQYFNERLAVIEQQISALINAINANNSLNRDSQRRFAVSQEKKLKNVAKSIFQPIQELHQKLAETLGFERRLVEMVNNKQIQLNTASPSQSQKFSEELLVLHQRLGRCRQAISKLERQIELREKR